MLSLACTLTTPLSAQLFWDINGATAGAGGTAPAGTWASSGGPSNRRWSTNANGTASTAVWTSGADAVFSAGTDATGAFTVTVSGTQNVSSITVDEGSPTLGTGVINFNDASPDIFVAAGSTLTFGSALTSTTGNLNIGSASYTGTTVFSANTTLAGTVTLAGGTLRLSGSSYSFGALNVTGDTTLDLAGAVTFNVSAFSLSPGVTLTVTNWTGAVDYFYAAAWTGATYDTQGSTPTTQVVFNGFAGADTAWASLDNQVRPIPEPSAYASLMLAGLLGFFGWRRGRIRR